MQPKSGDRAALGSGRSSSQRRTVLGWEGLPGVSPRPHVHLRPHLTLSSSDVGVGGTFLSTQHHQLSQGVQLQHPRTLSEVLLVCPFLHLERTLFADPCCL